ncbi:MAG: chorismate mutase [Phycisphaeraceae bacterium]|nr:MAG: chorismate mutase [Phycisphaeraceae bacterium]
MPKKPAKKKSAKKPSTGQTARQKPASKKPAGKKTTAKKTPARQPAPKNESARDSAALASLRTKIDSLDKRLVSLLNDRAKLVVEVGNHKRGTAVPIYAPHREAEVLERALGANKGPLSGRTIEGIYRELMSGSFALEQPLRIGYLGPPGSNSHAASVKQFGSSVEYEDLHLISGVFTEVIRGHVNYGLVPIENSTGGGITETLDAFIEHAHDISIYAEVQINVHHALLANCKPAAVRRIHSKPEIFAQCRQWLATQYPQAELVAAASSSKAAQIAVEEDNKAREIGMAPGAAAIGTALAGELYGLKILFPRIEDNPNNITRFYVISRERAKRTGDDKTSIIFQTEHAAGALVDVLAVFRDAGINLSHIDKRPSGRKNWTYSFFIDAVGHRDDDAMRDAIDEARGHCRELQVLGSFPRSKRIL